MSNAKMSRKRKPKRTDKSGQLPPRCVERDGLCLCNGGPNVLCLVAKERDDANRSALHSLSKLLDGKETP